MPHFYWVILKYLVEIKHNVDRKYACFRAEVTVFQNTVANSFQRGDTIKRFGLHAEELGVLMGSAATPGNQVPGITRIPKWAPNSASAGDAVQGRDRGQTRES